MARAAIVLLLVLAAGASVRAAPTRPNALDRRVDAIPSARLLAQPATALVDVEREKAAIRLQSWLTPLWCATIALQILALAYFWQAGGAARWRNWLRRSVGGEFVVRFCFGATLAAIARVAALVPQFLDYRVARAMQLAVELSGTWFSGWLAGTLFAMAAAGVVASVVLWLADRTHQWYIYVAVAAVAGSLLFAWANPLVVAPLFNRYTPLPDRPYGRRIAALQARAGLSGLTLAESHLASQTESGASSVIGLWNSRRVVFSDTLLAGATAREVAFVAARDFGEVAAAEPLQMALADALAAIAIASLAVFVADRIGFRRDDDEVSRLALVAALLVCSYVVVVPGLNAYHRHLASQADRFAVALTHDPVAGIRSAIRMANQGLVVVCPSPFARAYLNDLPSVGSRVAALQGRPDPCR